MATHKEHLEEIKTMEEQAEGEEKEKLTQVLAEAQEHVNDLESTVQQARGKMISEMDADTVALQSTEDI